MNCSVSTLIIIHLQTAFIIKSFPRYLIYKTTTTKEVIMASKRYNYDTVKVAVARSRWQLFKSVQAMIQLKEHHIPTMDEMIMGLIDQDPKLLNLFAQAKDNSNN